MDRLNGLIDDFGVNAFDVMEQADLMADDDDEEPLVSFDQFIATIDFSGDDTDIEALKTMYIERNAGTIQGGVELDEIYTIVQGAQSRLLDIADAMMDLQDAVVEAGEDVSTVTATVNDVMDARLDFYGC